MKTDGVVFYLHISQNHFYEKKKCVDKALGFTSG